MNCKQGDLAIVVRAINPKNIGKICRCLKHVKKNLREPDTSINQYDCWETDVEFEGWGGDKHYWCMDNRLKPLRDNDGEDEILRITGKPEKKLEKV